MKKTILPYIVFASLIVSCGNSSSSKYPEDSVRVDASKMEVEARPDTLSTVEARFFSAFIEGLHFYKKGGEEIKLAYCRPEKQACLHERQPCLCLL